MNRWIGEEILVEAEMEWTALFFQRRISEWIQRSASSAVSSGRYAHALQQAAMWRHLHSSAEFGLSKVAELKQRRPEIGIIRGEFSIQT